MSSVGIPDYELSNLINDEKFKSEIDYVYYHPFNSRYFPFEDFEELLSKEDFLILKGIILKGDKAPWPVYYGDDEKNKFCLTIDPVKNEHEVRELAPFSIFNAYDMNPTEDPSRLRLEDLFLDPEFKETYECFLSTHGERTYFCCSKWLPLLSDIDAYRLYCHANGHDRFRLSWDIYENCEQYRAMSTEPDRYTTLYKASLSYVPTREEIEHFVVTNIDEIKSKFPMDDVDIDYYEEMKQRVLIFLLENNMPAKRDTDNITSLVNIYKIALDSTKSEQLELMMQEMFHDFYTRSWCL
jgi:hypothetical protein